jgi:hypothetical protein
MTAAGHDEIRHRQRLLSQRHRTVLFLVDGRRTEAEVMALARAAGAPDDCLRDLADLGLILLPEPAASLSPAAAPGEERFDEDAGASALMPALSLVPDSSASGWSRPATPPGGGFSRFGEPGDSLDTALEQARSTLLRAVRTEAPIAGSLTQLRLRRARTRGQLLALLDEVQSHVRKPHRTLAATQMLQQVRALLADRDTPGRRDPP